MALSYLVITTIAALITIPASRYAGPFGFLRDSDLVHTFNHSFDNQTSGTFFIIALIGADWRCERRAHLSQPARQGDPHRGGSGGLEPRRFLHAVTRQEQQCAWAACA
jgi:hypothetical protein